ncbi:MAG: prepilin-type N-terminal cleavage/methylation domain-containing protein [Myxococcales bacterium]|nr:prepilin-type N-terminal cleavage/methylation domain-containing protein [Myxococcales bacterium]
MRFRHQRGGRDQRGFTLIELLVVVAILAGLALLAVPALTSANYEGKLREWSRRMAQDLQRARYEAIAQREDRIIKITSNRTYELLAEVPGSGTQTLVKRVTLPEQVLIVGLQKCLAIDNLPSQAGGVGGAGTACAIPGSFATGHLKFSAIRTMRVDIGGTEDDRSATLWLKTEDNKHYSRVVVYRTTGNVRYIEGQ